MPDSSCSSACICAALFPTETTNRSMQRRPIQKCFQTTWGSEGKFAIRTLKHDAKRVKSSVLTTYSMSKATERGQCCSERCRLLWVWASSCLASSVPAIPLWKLEAQVNGSHGYRCFGLESSKRLRLLPSWLECLCRLLDLSQTPKGHNSAMTSSSLCWSADSVSSL